MMNNCLERSEAIRKHRELWMKISEITTPELLTDVIQNHFDEKEEKLKEAALKAIGETRKLKNHCYCCQYCEDIDDDCEDCPIRWSNRAGKNNLFCTNNGEYGRWFRTLFYEKNIVKANELAMIIANLPEREEFLDEHNEK